jgi:ABC-type lipoprotein release transport system permease subunit
MHFRNPLFNWIAQHPGVIFWTLFAVVLALPIFLYLLPIKKVPLRYNLRNLQARWVTTLVTALVFTAVVGLLVTMLAFVKGMERLTEGTGDERNVIVLSDGATDEVFSNLFPFSVKLLPDELQREVQDSKQTPETPLAVQEVYVLVTHMIPNPTPGGRTRRFVQMRGIDKPAIAAELHGIELAHGTWPSAAGVHTLDDGDTAPEIVLGNGVARTFGADVGKDLLMPGDVVQLGPRRWYVTGVMKDRNSSFSSEIWANDSPVQENFGRNNPRSYSTYVLRASTGEKAKLAVALLKGFRPGERSLVSYTESDYYKKLSQTSQDFSKAIYFIAAFMALGGILGVMNTMFAAISQRTKDIGVMRLMGYRRIQILLSFQLESLLIAIMGGILGCLLAYLIFNGWTATSVISGAGGGGGKSVVLRLTFDAEVLFSGFIFTLLMGAIGGFIPSINAMRLRPLESLK